MSDTVCRHLKVLPLAVAFGVCWGLGMIFVSWISWWTTNDYGDAFIKLFASVYIGYKADFWGGIVGFLWGFLDWFIGGLIIAWVYNGFSCCCAKKTSESE
jgi:hypothetical protein